MTTKSRSSFRARPVFAAAVLLLVAASDPLSAAERERDARAEKPPTSRAPAPAPQLVLPERSGTSRAVRDIPRVYRVPDPHKLREVQNESLEEGRRSRAVAP